MFSASFPRGGPPSAGAPLGQSIITSAAAITLQSAAGAPRRTPSVPPSTEAQLQAPPAAAGRLDHTPGDVRGSPASPLGPAY